MCPSARDGSEIHRTALVIGGGIAATSCAEALLHQLGENSIDDVDVKLITPTSTISAGVIVSSFSRRIHDISLHPRDVFEWSSITSASFRIASAVSLDVQSRILQLSDGTSVPFSVVCIATGASPFVPPLLQRPPLKNFVFTLRDAASITRLRSELSTKRTALLVGNGALAMEAAHELKGSVARVIWAARDKHVGAALFDAAASRALGPLLDHRDVAAVSTREAVVSTDGCEDNSTDAHTPFGPAPGPRWKAHYGKSNIAQSPTEKQQENGSLDVRIGVEVREATVDKTGDKVTVHLSDGTTEQVEIIVCATGVAPNVDWLRGCGGIILAKDTECEECHGGVRVLAGTMQSDVEYIYAAGDCASVVGEVGENWFQRRLWTQAQITGTVAGRAMAARLMESDCESGLEFEVFAHVTRFFGQRVVFLGRYSAQNMDTGFVIMENVGDDGGIIRAVVQNGKVKGALLVGDSVADLAETFENLICTGLDVSNIGQALVDPTANIEDYFD